MNERGRVVGRREGGERECEGGRVGGMEGSGTWERWRVVGRRTDGPIGRRTSIMGA